MTNAFDLLLYSLKKLIKIEINLSKFVITICFMEVDSNENKSW